MATTSKTITIALKHERTEEISERYPTTTATYIITASEAQVMVERDLALRCRDADDDDVNVDPRSVSEIADELSKQDYNCAKKHLRHTRYRSATARDDDTDMSIVEVAPSGEGDDPAETWATRIMVREALAKLAVEDRIVLVGIHMRGMTQTQIARVLGVSQPAVVKRLRKAEARLRELLS